MSLKDYRYNWPNLRPNYLAKLKNRFVECISWPWNENGVNLINIRKPGDPTTLQLVTTEELIQINIICTCGENFPPYYYSTSKLQCPHCYGNYTIDNVKIREIPK